MVMKKTNENKTKRVLTVIMAAALAIGMLTGCGEKGSFSVEGLDPNQPAVEQITEETVEEAVPEEEEEGGVVTPFLADLEKYDSIISTLTTNQYYAFADAAKDYDVLLVADGVFDNGDGTMAAIDAKVYGFDGDGNVCEAGSVWSDGTAYPIAVVDGFLMFGGNHRMAMASVIDGSVVIEKEAYEEFDEAGNATYFYDEGDIDHIQEVADDSYLAEFYKTYENAVVLSFTQGTVEAEPVGDMDMGDAPANEFEARVGKNTFESYDEIIGLLEGDEAYAYAKVKGYAGKTLLIAESVYDDLLGHMATIECTLYTVKSNGVCTADSMVFSGGTATPISISNDGVIYTATHTSVEKYCYGDNGSEDKALMMLAYVYADELDDNGNAKAVGGFVRTKNSLVNDDSVFLGGTEIEVFSKLYAEYFETEPISFTKVTE